MGEAKPERREVRKHSWAFYGSTTPSGENIWVCIKCGRRSTAPDRDDNILRECKGQRGDWQKMRSGEPTND